MKAGFTLIELMVVMSIVGVLGSTIVPAAGNLRESARDAERISDVQQISLALQINKDQLTDEFSVVQSTIPTAVGTELPAVPQNNTENDGDYGWADNTAEPEQFCLWAVLERDIGDGNYYVGTHRGAGYVDDQPSSFLSCAFYEEGSHDTGDENNDDKAFVCHINKKGKEKTLNIGVNAVPAHLGHGDYLGECI